MLLIVPGGLFPDSDRTWTGTDSETDPYLKQATDIDNTVERFLESPKTVPDSARTPKTSPRRAPKRARKVFRIVVQ